MMQVLSRQSSWNCPFKMVACCCSKCRNDTNNYQGGDPNHETPVKDKPLLKNELEMKRQLLFEERKN